MIDLVDHRNKVIDRNPENPMIKWIALVFGVMQED
jgi:hypothetical protein